MNDIQKPKTRIASVLEDPSAQAIARVYAKAFLGAVGDEDAAEQLEELASFIEDVVAVNPDFETILYSSMVNRDDKISLLDRVLPGRASQPLINFLRVLARHDRLELLPLIAEQAQLEHETRTGRQRVQVTSASPLAEDRLQKIKKTLADKLSFEPIVQPQVDPAIIGGLIIQIGNDLYDGSLRTQLKQLRGRLRHRSLHEIQSGRDRFSHSERD